MATSQASLNEGVETLASVIADPKKESNAENGDNETSESESFQNNIPKRMSVFSYVMSELTRGYLLERDKDTFTERRQRVYTFMRTPRELEKFLLYGVLQCVDTFLFIFTFLPLRIVLASLKILTHPCGVFIRRSHNVLEPAQICDILKGIILVVCLVIVNHIDTSMMYHLVRGQAVIKLYVFFNMLEMADRLFSSFGQDILDALFWTATEPRGRKRDHLGTIPHLILAIIYVDQVWVIIPDAVLVLVAEVMVDWIKHAFILKFNETKADVYRKFTVRLAKDMISNRQSRAFIDYSDQVSRRMTLTPLPVACLLLRICTKSFKISGHIGILIIVVLYFW
ncbi:hypothetical protein KUTeg_005572 [Tegillarca granosa]|uniref:Uncharacterized protein n=1 Tax=Tegillarca granosa TaxID=220873 RepID=A0ABQ9FPN3_TEGGR|nr:hypothetical protein KUTeg_005572 [Tegillarca granosa]